MTAAKKLFSPFALELHGIPIHLLIHPEGAVLALSFSATSLLRAHAALCARAFVPCPLPTAIAEATATALDLFLLGVSQKLGLTAHPFFLDAATAFQRRIWQAIVAIPYGQTRTYRQIATAAGASGSTRAAGGACGANPVALLVPCHRVVASQGLGGFGGGAAVKKRLLLLEAAGAKKAP